MSRRTPTELMWQEHSKPAIQKERKSPLPDGRGSDRVVGSVGFMGRLVVFGRNQILLPLRIHEALAPFQIEMEVALCARPARGQRNLLDRKLRRPVGVEQPVGLLVGVAELRV